MDESSRLNDRRASSRRAWLAPRRAQGHGSCALPELSAAIGVLLLSACMGDKGTANSPAESANHPPTIKAVSILPTPTVLAGPLTVRVEAQDLDLDTVRFQYRWFANGNVISGQTGGSLPAALLKRGDQVSVEVTPFDGTTNGLPYLSAPVLIVNTPPIVPSLTVDIDYGAQGRQLLAHAEVLDPDHDEVMLTYRWKINDSVTKEGQDNTLSVTGLTSQDVVSVEVTASDGNTNGTTTTSGRFAMSNSSPTITSKPPVSTDGGVYTYLVQASDADGDPITYKLEDGPPGMSIGEQTGQIHWAVTSEATGKHHIKVVAQDNRGGFAAQDFDVSVAAPPKAS